MTATDLLVSLYQQDFKEIELSPEIRLKRGMIADKDTILALAAEYSAGWARECELALMQQPSKIWIAVKNHEIIGFACFDTTAKGFFGPTFVKPSEQGQKIGAALLLKSMISLKEMGYAYAIIGWSDEATDFYKKIVGAVEIPGASPDKSVYQNLARF